MQKTAALIKLRKGMFMRIRCRRLAVMLALVLILICIPQTASANSPPAAPIYTFYIENYPENTVYADLLIYLPKTDPQYQPLVEQNIPEGFSETAEIISYCEEDYRSYTFHYKGAKSRICLDDEGSIVFFEDGTRIYDDSIAFGHQEDIEGRGQIRLALLDVQGNILLVSRPHSLKPEGLFSYSVGSFHYDAARDNMLADSESNGGAFLVFILVAILGTAMNCFIEWMVALAFDGVKNHTDLVLVTNLCSQILMRILQVILLGILMTLDVLHAYMIAVAMLEILVYLGEFLVYRKRMGDVSLNRCIAYTLCANTASLMAGLLIPILFVLPTLII